MPRPQGPNYPVIRELVRRTDFSERSIRYWLATHSAPKNAILAKAWTTALAAAQRKIAAQAAAQAANKPTTRRAS
jgi:hypothetical protein